jgi:predicted metal-dependent hydrolase
VQISHEDGVVVVIPKRLQKSCNVDALLDERSQWIQHQIQRLAIDTHAPHAEQQLPTQIHLPSIFVSRTLLYQPLAARTIRIRDTGDDLVLQGNVQDIPRVTQCLKKWIRSQIEALLRTRLQDYEQQTGLQSNSLRFAWQKRRWGSCSGRGEIVLNLKLAFLPLEYIDYIICHELAHLRHMAHNRAFWNLLQKWLPQALQLDADLFKVAQFIPRIFH